MKNIGILLIITLLLASVAYYLVSKDGNSTKTIYIPDRNFTIKSMDEVDKIVMKQVNMTPFIFQKKGKSWILNDKYPVNPDVFVNIEKVLLDMKMVYIPAKTATATIMKNMKEIGIQVDLYGPNDDKPFKIIYVGTDTQNSEGTFMVLGGYSQPYVMGLTGLIGGLRSRFEQPFKNYRDMVIYNEPLDQIESVTINYPQDKQSSFSLKVVNNNVEVSPLDANTPLQTKPLNQKAVSSLLSSFTTLHAETIQNDAINKDTILQLPVFANIELKLKNGKVKNYTYFSYDDYLNKTHKDRGPNDIPHNNRLYVHTQDNDLFTIQTRMFSKIFWRYQAFYQ